jgi:hypothetical protein
MITMEQEQALVYGSENAPTQDGLAIWNPRESGPYQVTLARLQRSPV